MKYITVEEYERYKKIAKENNIEYSDPSGLFDRYRNHTKEEAEAYSDFIKLYFQEVSI